MFIDVLLGEVSLMIHFDQLLPAFDLIIGHIWCFMIISIPSSLALFIFLDQVF